jgi:hypothetical protein
VLDQAIATIAVDGNLKFYGGEPTLHADDVIDAIRYVRRKASAAWFRSIPMA